MISQIVAKHVEPRALDELSSYTGSGGQRNVTTARSEPQERYEVGMTMPLSTIEALRKMRRP